MRMYQVLLIHVSYVHLFQPKILQEALFFLGCLRLTRMYQVLLIHVSYFHLFQPKILQEALFFLACLRLVRIFRTEFERTGF